MKNTYRDKTVSDEVVINAYLTTLDASLFKIIHERYEYFIFNKCLNFTKSSQEAEDMCQDIFLKLVLKLSTFNGNSKFSTWLYALTFNHCVNHYNRNKHINFETNFFSMDQIIDKELPLSKDEHYLDFIKLEKLSIAMNKIPSLEKDLLVMKYYNFKSIKELGSFYNLGESAVKMRLKRAKDKLLVVYNRVNS